MHAAGSLAAYRDTDDATVRAIVRDSGSSFFWAMRLLPRDRRQAMFAVYAFCRAVDDVADATAGAAWKRDELARWRAEIDRLFAGAPGRPVTRSLAGPVAAYDLPRDDFEAVIAGMEMDADGPLIAPDTATLRCYCDRVAGAVGRLSVRIFGAGDADGMAVAGHLGRALQLTNILRDLDEDAAVDRLYLPRETLEAHGVPTHAARAAVDHARIDSVCREVARTAEGAFVDARDALGRCDARAMRPARIMMEVYRRSLVELCARGWSPPRQAVGPGKLAKLWIALQTCAGWRR